MPHTKNAKDQFENPTEKKDQSGLSNITDTARDVARSAVDKADSAASKAGENISSFGETVREKGPKEGYLGAATRTVASGIESTGDYLANKGVSGMADDMVSVLRNYPIATLLVGVGIGFLLARSMSRR